jgi:abortive infection bacteriophage resistance protein
MSIHNKPLEIEEQVLLMKKYVVFSKKVRMKKFLLYAGYFRASRYGKYLLSNTTILGKKPEQDLLFAIYDFDMKLREVLMKYCKKAEIQFKSHLSNSISIKTDTATFYLNDDYYTPSKSERDKKKKESNIRFFENFKRNIINNERKLRSDILKYPELKDYRKGGKKSKYKIPSWVAFSYFEFGTITLIYSYLKGDLRKEVLKYGYSKNRYGKEVTKQVDTWLDAIRNLRNVCAHHNVLVGRTSSIVLFNNEDYDLTLSLSNTNLFSRLYALKKVLNNDDARLLKEDLEKIIKRSKIDIYELNILPVNWEDIYDGIKLL